MSLLITSEFGIQFYPALKQYLIERIEEFPSIPTDRKSDLAVVAQYVRGCLAKSLPAKLTLYLHPQFTTKSAIANLGTSCSGLL